MNVGAVGSIQEQSGGAADTFMHGHRFYLGMFPPLTTDAGVWSSQHRHRAGNLYDLPVLRNLNRVTFALDTVHARLDEDAESLLLVLAVVGCMDGIDKVAIGGHDKVVFIANTPKAVGSLSFRLQKGKREAIEEVIRERKQRRMESQPLEYPSAGSVFRNPEDNFAGKLIEDVGLKGKIYGGAMVSDKHANFIVNHNGASADDVKYLIDLCHDKVLEEYGIDMRIEQEFVNWE